MISENENLITNILPFLEENLKWKRDDMKFETVCSAGRIDVLYRPNNKNTAVLEVKKKKALEEVMLLSKLKDMLFQQKLL